MKYSKIRIGSLASGYDYWISGIYKIVSYRKGEYHAYFIQEWARNWGDNVSKPPEHSKHGVPCWKSLKSAKKACSDHAKRYTPSPSIAERAIEIMDAYINQYGLIS